MENLAFINFQLVDYSNIESLKEIQKEQLLLSGKVCWGVETTEMKKVLDETYDGNCELWQVVNKKERKKVLYDVWVFNVDTAVVYFSGTKVDTGVGMIQNYFDAIDDDTEENQKLAKELQEAYNQRPEVDYDEHTSAGAYKKAVDSILKSSKKNLSDFD